MPLDVVLTEGQVLTHQLPISPKPLPKLEVREVNGVIEVFAPPSRPADLSRVTRLTYLLVRVPQTDWRDTVVPDD